MPIEKSRAAKTAGTRKSSQAPLGETWDHSTVDKNDERANLQAGDKGKEPGGRWSPAYYESGPKIISGDDIRDA